MKNIKFYLNSKEIPFEELSEIPQMMTDRENHTRTEIVLHYIGKDAIYFYTLQQMRILPKNYLLLDIVKSIKVIL